MKLLNTILGFTILTVGTMLSIYYVGISEPITQIDQLRAVVFLLINIPCYSYVASMFLTNGIEL